MRINLPNGSYIEEAHPGGWGLFFDDGQMIRRMNSIEMNLIIAAYHQGKKDNQVVISRDPSGYIVAVTRQDEDGQILQIVAEGRSAKG
jgi:hypothetical protein